MRNIQPLRNDGEQSQVHPFTPEIIIGSFSDSLIPESPPELCTHTHTRHVYKSASFSLFAVCFPLSMDREARSSGEAERLLSAVTRQIVRWWSGRVWRRDPGSGPRPPLIHYPAADWLMCCCFTLCERFRDVNDLELDTRHHDRCLVACFLYVSRFFKGFYLVFISDTFVLDAASLSLSLGVCLRPSSPGWVTV